MNCIEFRRQLLTDPGCVEPAFVEHKSSCIECAEAVRESARFEQRLGAAMRIPVPENLASRILLKQSFLSRARPAWWRRPSLYALAASLVLAVGLVVNMVSTYQSERELSDEFVALINAAPYSLASSDRVDADDISAALEPIGVRLEGDIGNVTFASRCWVRGLLSGHLVLQGKTGKVTVFLIPQSLVNERAGIRSRLFSGVVLPQDGGTIAILSAPGETIDELEARVRLAIRWKA